MKTRFGDRAFSAVGVLALFIGTVFFPFCVRPIQSTPLRLD